MTKIFQLLCIAFLSITFLGGCSGSGTIGSSSSTYYMSANIGGAPFNVTQCVATYASSLNLLAITGSTVTGGTGGPPEMILLLDTWTGGTGTFSLYDRNNNSRADYSASIGSITKLSTTGFVMISRVTTTTITGTFGYTCEDGTVVTSGRFHSLRY